MKIIIDEENVKSHNLSLKEFLYLILVYKDTDLEEVKKSLLSKKFITETLLGVKITEKGKKKLDKSNESSFEIDYDDLAKKLRDIYPQGRKAGTSCMWKDSTPIIARKLKTLVEKYKCNFTEEQAIRVTEQYVKSFNGDYTYMQVLKYFLLKTVTIEGSEREVKSEFMSRLENEGQEDTLRNDWISTII